MKMSLEEAEAWVKTIRDTPSKQTTRILREFTDLGNGVQIMWAAGFWNVPLSGYARHGGKTGYWVDMLEERWNTQLDLDDFCAVCDCDGAVCVTDGPLYAVYRLTEQQDQYHAERHARSITRRSDHIEYRDPTNPDTYPRYPGANETEPPPLTKDQIIGWTLEINPKGLIRTLPVMTDNVSDI